MELIITFFNCQYVDLSPSTAQVPSRSWKCVYYWQDEHYMGWGFGGIYDIQVSTDGINWGTSTDKYTAMELRKVFRFMQFVGM